MGFYSAFKVLILSNRGGPNIIDLFQFKSISEAPVTSHVSYRLNIPINLRWETWCSDFVLRLKRTGWMCIDLMRFTQSSRHQTFRLVITLW